MKTFVVTNGETVLLQEGGSLKWVRVVQAGQVASNGTQAALVKDCDQYGRSKPRRVTIGGTAYVKEVM